MGGVVVSAGLQGPGVAEEATDSPEGKREWDGIPSAAKTQPLTSRGATGFGGSTGSNRGDESAEDKP